MNQLQRNLQIRLRTDQLEDVKLALQDYLGTKYMIFRHQPLNNKENIHYHVYIFEVLITAESIRKKLCRLKYKKENYCVKTKAGKNQTEDITPSVAYQYATAPKSNPTICEIVGFTDEEQELFKTRAFNYYNPPIIATPEDSHLPTVVFKVDRVWARLKEDLDSYEGLAIKSIKSKIAAQWLNDGKAMPRPSDLHRYAVSIYYMNKYKDKDSGLVEIPDDALVEQFNNPG